jgi:hypothetical protein
LLKAKALYRCAIIISVSTFADYSRFGNNVAGSTFIKQRGSESQFVSGLSLSYQFGFWTLSAIIQINSGLCHGTLAGFAHE